ncbi:hypothetical protein [Nocardia sp. NPDC051750]|uniref:hypothetical protein n=1 Tax=Nocardia sp. NPDC051750 TaxID=3364325 RepID=UPI0037B80572
MTGTEHNQQDARPADPTGPQYYAARGATRKTEQEMRADYTRAAQLRRESLRAETVEQVGQLFDQAKQVEDRWWNHESPAVRADWDYLDDAYHDWRHSAGTMERLYEQVMIDRVDGVTSGMSEVQWRSQRQAREMAGHGRWAQAQEAFGARPWNIHPVDPRSAEHWAHHSASPGEQLMRGDFAQVYLLDRRRSDTYTDREYMQVTEMMYTVSEPWVTRSDEFGETWRDMRRMSARYNEARSEEAMDQLAQQYRSIARDLGEPMFSRSVEQVHQLGTSSLAAELDADSSRNPSAPVSSARAAARTAELAQDNAFAGLSTNAFAVGREQKGMAR